jgi:lipoprotein-releasing system ATP-binding protein
MSSASLVRLAGVTKAYAGIGSEAETVVLRGIDLEIPAGDAIAILGPSGSGKTTLLNILGTLEPPSAGTVTWEGQDVFALSPDELAAFRNQKIGFVFQHHHLLPQCTAFENVLVPTLAGVARERTAVEARAKALLEQVGLGARLSHRPAQLSGGERQRVAVVRALINRPRLLLADEPTGSLDEEAADALGELLLELNEKEGVALVLVTHSRRLGERMDRILEIHRGVLAMPEATR